LLSDAALSIVVGDDVKWLYNSARRLRKPILRTSDAATWWRMVHHLSVGLGAPLNDAGRAADALAGSRDARRPSTSSRDR